MSFNPSKLLAALQYAPYVSQAVQQIEASNAALPGATKKQVVLAAVTAAASVGAQVPEEHVQTISALVDIIAGVLFPKFASQQQDRAAGAGTGAGPRREVTPAA